MNPIDKPTEHDEYNELLSIVGAGHMDQEHLARLRAHLGYRPDPAGVVREVASREPEGWVTVPSTATHNMLNAANAGRKKGRSNSGDIYRAMIEAAPRLAAQGAVEREPSGDALDARRWQPIETAPKNHLPVLTWSRLDGVRAAFRDITWRWLFVMPTTSARPTHWMPLPPAPDAAITAARQEPTL